MTGWSSRSGCGAPATPPPAASPTPPGNTYTELTHFKASDDTEMSVWTAPITAGGGTKPTITAKATSTADVGVAALEYAGLSTAAGTAVLDVQAHATGTSNGAATVTSGATPATTAGNELALGFYADSGFGDTLTPGSGFTSRVNVAPPPTWNCWSRTRRVGQGATPAATAATSASTTWLMATLVLAPASHRARRRRRSARRGVTASAGNGSASVTWTAPCDGGSPITSYTVTPYVAGVPQQTTTVTGNPPSHLGHRHRPDQRHELHLHGQRDQRESAPARSQRPPTRSRRARCRRASGGHCRPGRSSRCTRCS